MLALVLSGLIGTRLHVTRALVRKTQGHYLAMAGVNRSISQVALDVSKETDALSDYWMNNPEVFKDIPLGDGGFRVIQPFLDLKTEAGVIEEGVATNYGLIDEERKININTADKKTLTRLFEILGGLEPMQASEIAAAILDWRDENEDREQGGAESDHYRSEAGYSCKNAPFQVLEELLLVRGVSPDLFREIRNFLTIFGLGAVNINTCSIPVMKVLGASESLAKKIVHYRAGLDGREGTSDDRVIEDISTFKAELSKAEPININEMQELSHMVGSGKLTVRSDNFSGISEGYLNGDPFKVSIAFTFNRNQKIKFFKEN
jgi:DNA uptake protein ComE-like DNA-binding protein